MTDKTMKTWTIRTEGDRMEVALADAPPAGLGAAKPDAAQQATLF